MLTEKLKILRSHGRQWIRDLDGASVPMPYRGCPVITRGIDAGQAAAVVVVCPTAAIESTISDGLRIDLGRCIFCGECARMAPAHITFSTNHRMAAVRREDLIIGEGAPDRIPFDSAAVRPVIRKYFRHALKLRQVSAGGDNSCEMELNASMNVNFDFSRYGVEFVASPRHADGIVITGPVTANMAGALRMCYAAIPEPKIMIVVGAEAISGGLFAGSPAIERAFLNDHTPDLWIPGSPCHPLTFIDGVMKLTGHKFDR